MSFVNGLLFYIDNLVYNMYSNFVKVRPAHQPATLNIHETQGKNLPCTYLRR